MEWLYLRINFEIHALTCPGVWICQSGPVVLKIRSLGYVFCTSPVQPRFPLILHEEFSMEGYFKDVHSIMELKQKLSQETIDLSLYQNGHRLAFFRESLGNILCNQQSCKNILEVELLMNATKCFPGIIAPKVESRIEFTIRKYNPNSDCLHSLKMRSPSCGTKDESKGSQRFHGHSHSKEKGRQTRQKSVCHNQFWTPMANNFIPTNIMRHPFNEDSCLGKSTRA